jgi:hypothetical protein
MERIMSPSNGIGITVDTDERPARPDVSQYGLGMATPPLGTIHICFAW